MTITYADITVNSVWDGDLVIQREVFAGGDWEFVRLTMKTGGRRTEAANFSTEELQGLRIANPVLVDVPNDELLLGAGVFADQAREGWDGMVDALHGVALEIHRRRALACVERGCWKADRGCVCHRGRIIHRRCRFDNRFHQGPCEA